MSSKNKDEILSKFIAITNCPSNQAVEYLEAAEWNEQAAIDFFLIVVFLKLMILFLRQKLDHLRRILIIMFLVLY